jgi:hypothetical protein
MWGAPPPRYPYAPQPSQLYPAQPQNNQPTQLVLMNDGRYHQVVVAPEFAPPGQGYQQGYHQPPPPYQYSQPPPPQQQARGEAGGGGRNGGGGGGKKAGTDDPSLTLSISAVKSGADTRTSLMVRNIPNKYVPLHPREREAWVLNTPFAGTPSRCSWTRSAPTTAPRSTSST